MRRLTRPVYVYPLILVTFMALGLGASCAKAPPNLTPQAQTAYQARRVLDVLRVVRDTAVDAEAQNPKLISTADARKIVTWHESLVKAIDAAPSGAKAVVEASLVELQTDVAPATWQRLAPYVVLVRSVIGAL